MFGCRAFVYIPKDERAKLDAKTKECIYLRSPKDEFGYRSWDPINKRIIRSRDVVFFEDQTIEDIKNLERPRLRRSKNTEPTLVRHEDNNTQESSDAEDHEIHDEPVQEESQSSTPTAPDPR